MSLVKRRTRSDKGTLELSLEDLQKRAQELECSLNRVVLGKELAIRALLSAFFAGGHVLLEDHPGSGKTFIAKTLSVLCSRDLAKNTKLFSRIQCTPDLLPYDITGVELYERDQQKFRFEEGPLFASLVLADELNRASPKAQSAFLEAMEEGHVSLGKKTYILPRPFFLLATQNPFDRVGTYPLPQAQLDRFMMRVSLGYSSFEDEVRIMESYVIPQKFNVEPILSLWEILAIEEKIHTLFVDIDLYRAVASLLDFSRQKNPSMEFFTPLSSRAGLLLLRAAKAHAFLEGRDYVIAEDIELLLPFVLLHRFVPLAQQDSMEDARGLIVEFWTQAHRRFCRSI